MIQTADFQIRFEGIDDFPVIGAALIQTMLEYEYPDLDVDVTVKDLKIWTDAEEPERSQ